MSIKNFEQFLNENNTICEKLSPSLKLGSAENYINRVKSMNKMGEDIIKSILKEYRYTNGNRLKFIDYPISYEYPKKGEDDKINKFVEKYGEDWEYSIIVENAKNGELINLFNLFGYFDNAKEGFWLLGIWLGDDGEIHMDCLTEFDGIYEDNKPTLSDKYNIITTYGKNPKCDDCERENDLTTCVFWANIMDAIIKRFKQLRGGKTQLSLFK